MTLLTRVVINGLQLPARGLSAAEARAKAVQPPQEPAESTPEPEVKNGETPVIPPSTQGA